MSPIQEFEEDLAELKKKSANSTANLLNWCKPLRNEL